MDKKLLKKASQSEFYQDRMHKVLSAITEEIRKAINKLFQVTAFPEAYKDFPSDIDYKTFVKKLSARMEQEAPFGILWAINPPVEENSSSKIQDKKSSSSHDIFSFEIADLFFPLNTLPQRMFGK